MSKQGTSAKQLECPSLLWAVRVRGRQFNSREPSGLNKLSIDREMFSSCVDAGLVLALPFHRRDLETDCVGVSTRRGTYARDKIPLQDFGLKMQGGLYARGGGGGICGTLQYIYLLYVFRMS